MQNHTKVFNDVDLGHIFLAGLHETLREENTLRLWPKQIKNTFLQGY